MQRSLLVVLSGLLLSGIGCDGPPPIATEADCTVGEASDAFVCESGNKHSISVLLIHPEGEAPMLTEGEVSAKIAGANAVIATADSPGDVACCASFHVFSNRAEASADSHQHSPANVNESQALLGRQLATLVVVKEIGACFDHSGDAVGCAYIGSGFAIIEHSAAPEAWAHELIHALGIEGHLDSPEMPHPLCSRELELAEKATMCRSAPAGKRLRSSDCDALASQDWAWPDSATVGGMGASAERTTCKIPK
jgi:hypothetical protein